jgi:hypothetical protein
MIINENRTKAYIATVNLNDEEDRNWVKAIRKAVSETNVFYKERGQDTRKYVKLQGRGHRMGKREYNQSLPLSFAERADIYVYDR